MVTETRNHGDSALHRLSSFQALGIMKSVFIVQYLNVQPNGEETVMFIGAYRSYESANATIERLKSRPGFCDHPQLIDPFVDDEEAGFYIDECELDKDHWTEGFITVDASGKRTSPADATLDHARNGHGHGRGRKSAADSPSK